jgi:putative spermidine/putrescine transport system ATP-binding protein
MTMAYLQLKQLRKTFGPAVAVDAFDLDVERGEFISFLGPSGCGKTTTLRMIAGFEMPTSGSIHIDGVDMTNVPASKRKLGMVFQSYALFPNMTVAENVGFGMKVAGSKREQIRARVAEMLELIQMGSFGQRYAHQLSGGQQQRVALARALAVQPRVLLLDEPLSALDAKIRDELRNEIRRIQRELGITTIYVTHDQGEALALSDRIVVMNAGKVEQIGPSFEIYNKPKTPFVAAFVGSMSTLKGTMRDVQHVRIGTDIVALAAPLTTKRAGDAVTLTVRPETLSLTAAPGANALHAIVENVMLLGAIVRIQLRVEADNVIADVLNHPGLVLPRIGDTIAIYFSPDAIALAL